MSEKIANTFTFHGNAEVKALEDEIVRRQTEDKNEGNNEIAAIKRILFGLQDSDSFDADQRMGAHWVHLLPSDGKLVFLSKQCAVAPLQDFITVHAAKIDPKVVVQMDYEGNTPTLIGSRFTAIDDDGDIVYGKAEEELDCWFCDEDDVDALMADLESDGIANPSVMSFQQLDDLKRDCMLLALDDFKAFSGRPGFVPGDPDAEAADLADTGDEDLERAFMTAMSEKLEELRALVEEEEKAKGQDPAAGDPSIT